MNDIRSNIKGLHHKAAKIQVLQKLNLWQRLNSCKRVIHPETCNGLLFNLVFVHFKKEIHSVCFLPLTVLLHKFINRFAKDHLKLSDVSRRKKYLQKCTEHRKGKTQVFDRLIKNESDQISRFLNCCFSLKKTCAFLHAAEQWS